MKKMPIKILAAFLTLSFLFIACTKENPDVRLDPKLSTAQVLSVSSNSATVQGFVVAQAAGFVEKGVCYATTPHPTVSNTKVKYSGTETTATYNVNLTGLNYATTYYARAYAIDASGNAYYGEEFTIVTNPVIPTITTTAATTITGTTAVSGGNITNAGGAAVTARGVCWSTKANPTIADSKTTDGTGVGTFTSNLTGLQGLTTYHVRAYATNSAGTAYGQDLTFTTLVAVRNWYVPGNYVAASYPGAGLNDWEPAKSPMVKSLASAPDKIQGYVYMAGASNAWKVASQPNWDGPNYGDGGAGQLSASGGDISSPAGYYKIDIDAATMKYTAIATTWGVIGDATPNGWNDETALIYNPALKTWNGAFTMDAGKYFKFRANHTWDLNYGSTAKDGATLDAGGSDIAITVAADYFITLDLSSPWNYKYSANRWGIIGSATAGGWDSDQNMTWDATNKVMTATLALTVGEIKFRANDDWGVNLGGNLNGLTAGGDNIAVSAAGNYKITLDLLTNKATITKL